MNLRAGPLIQVSTPAKQHIGAVGDRLLLEMTSADQARIIEIEPRENILYRSDAFKSNIIESNVDQTWRNLAHCVTHASIGFDHFTSML